VQRLRKLTSSPRPDRERVVVLGSGWAGYTVAKDLDPKRYQTVVVSPRSYFAFTPLLASTAVGTLEFRTALEPLRTRRTNVKFFQGWADAVDFKSKKITIEEAVDDPTSSQALTEGRHANESKQERETEKKVEAVKGQLFDLTYDKLIVTVGCYSQTFGTPGVKENAYVPQKILRKKGSNMVAGSSSKMLVTHERSETAYSPASKPPLYPQPRTNSGNNS
jgi:NADH dehydrogenase FAD-containing subunit